MTHMGRKSWSSDLHSSIPGAAAEDGGGTGRGEEEEEEGRDSFK